MNRIVIATDGSNGAREALQKGLALARESGAVATVAYVRQAPRPILGYPFYQRALSDELQRAEAVLSEAEGLAAEAGVEIEREILEGVPAARILELAQARDADLIVVGSRGRGAIAGAVLGSVSAGLAHHSDRPILVVKPRRKTGRRAA